MATTSAQRPSRVEASLPLAGSQASPARSLSPPQKLDLEKGSGEARPANMEIPGGAFSHGPEPSQHRQGALDRTVSGHLGGGVLGSFLLSFGERLSLHEPSAGGRETRVLCHGYDNDVCWIVCSGWRVLTITLANSDRANTSLWPFSG